MYSCELGLKISSMGGRFSADATMLVSSLQVREFTILRG
jgi:hypothetical protein